MSINVVEKAKEIAAVFEDGFQLADVFEIVPRAMEIVEEVEGLDGAGKEKLCLELLNGVLDVVDLPGPDALTKPIIRRFLPAVIGLVARVSKGAYAVNK